MKNRIKDMQKLPKYIYSSRHGFTFLFNGEIVCRRSCISPGLQLGWLHTTALIPLYLTTMGITLKTAMIRSLTLLSGLPSLLVSSTNLLLDKTRAGTGWPRPRFNCRRFMRRISWQKNPHVMKPHSNAITTCSYMMTWSALLVCRSVVKLSLLEGWQIEW